MDVFITNESALEFWRMRRCSKEILDYRKCARKPPSESSVSSVQHCGKAWGLTLPLDIMVGELGSRRPSKAVRPHVCSKPLPDGSFVDAGDGLYVGSPELCFFQMAGEYPLARLIALGIELCGSYSLPGTASGGAGQAASDQSPYNLPTLTTKRKLKAFVARMEGRPGYRNAIKALGYIADCSASPMETILFILLVLPYRYGGYGLPVPELNGRIDPEKGEKQFTGRSFYRGDLLWREAKVIAEYNSDLEHADPVKIAEDAIRRSNLDICGFQEVTVTKNQIKNLDLLDKVARQIAVRTGKYLRCKDQVFKKAQRGLLRVLL